MPGYKDLLGMYRTAIMRGVEIIAMNEGNISNEPESLGVHEDLSRIMDVVDGPFTLLDGNISLLDNELRKFSNEEIEVLEKLHIVLSTLPEIDREIYKRFAGKENQ